MIFRKEVYFTRNMEDYNRAKAALMDHGIEYTTKSNPMTNPGRYHGTPFIDVSAAYEYHLFVASKDEENGLLPNIGYACKGMPCERDCGHFS